jgi:hypothetical protein
MQTDDLVGVKLLKLKILSNLLTHTLSAATSSPYSEDPSHPSKLRNEIMGIILTFKANKYRPQLVEVSQDFIEERRRLNAIAMAKPCEAPQIDDEIRKLLKEILQIDSSNNKKK